MKSVITCFIFLMTVWITAQQDSLALSPEIDHQYREDQFYIGLTYNLLVNRPDNVSQNSLPFGLHLGFIRDIPINTRRNIAFGVGLGYSLNSYFNNLQAIEQNGTIIYQLIDADTPFNRNRISTHLVEVPIEFRWRTSTASTYKFWRIYTGVRFGYVFANVSRFVSDTESTSFSNDDVERFQYDLYISMGYNTWNFYASLGLNTILEPNTVTTTGEEIGFRALKVGLIFYLL